MSEKSNDEDPVRTALIDAALVCDILKVRDLLGAGGDPDTRDDDGQPLLITAVLGGSLALVGLLLESGADIDARDGHGWTALHFAAQEHLPEVARLLIARGADVAAQDEEGASVLWRAVFWARGRSEIARLLLEAGARDDVASNGGETPRALAARIGETFFAVN